MATFEKIAFTEVGSGGAANITFNTILSSWTDLCLKVSARSTGAADWVGIQYNGTTTNYSQRHLQGGGTGNGVSFATSTADFALINNQSGSTASTFASGEIYIPNYAGSTNKSISADTTGEANTTVAYAQISAELWSNTSAITSITIYSNVGNLAQYTTATLYGIKKA
jgi:hypothetical protein